MKKENKQEIVELLEKTLNATREGSCHTGMDKIQLILSDDAAVVKIYIDWNLLDTVSVAADSGVAIIRDVMRSYLFN